MTEKIYDNVHVYRGPAYSRVEPQKKWCVASVSTRGMMMHHHQCHFKPVVQRRVKCDGVEKTYGFCKLHDPAAVEVKHKERSAKWRREAYEREASYKRQDQIKAARNACVDAIKKIAAGHNDPMTLAREVLALFPEEGQS